MLALPALPTDRHSPDISPRAALRAGRPLRVVLVDGGFCQGNGPGSVIASVLGSGGD